MEPTQTAPSTGGNQGALDPQAVALAQAIRQTESGNDPTAEGTSGEYGAYQWEPATWAKMSAAAGINVPLKQSTLEQQNQVAYTQIKAWKDQGYNPGQIASMWNAGEGDPDAYLTGNSGTNAEGVKYDTKAYADKVMATYQQFKGQSQGQPQGQGGNLPQAPNQPLAQQVIGGGSSGGYAPPTPPSGAQASQTSPQTGGGYAPPTPPSPSTQTPTQTAPTSGLVNGDGVSGIPQGGAGSASNLLGGKGLSDEAGALIAKYTPSWMGLGGVAGTPAAKDVSFPSAEQVGGSALQVGSNIGALASIPLTGGMSAAGLIGSSAALGGAQSAGSAMQQNQGASQVAEQGGIGGLISGATAGLLNLVSGALGAAATKSLNITLRPTAADLADGFDSQFAVDNGLTGSAQDVVNKTRTFMQGLTQQLQTALGNSPSTVDLADVFDKTEADLTSEEGNVANFGQTGRIGKALQDLENEVLTVNPTGSLPMTAVQQIKQAAGMYGEWANGVPDPEANAAATAYNAFYHNLKTAIEDAVPEGNIADINSQLQDAIPVLRAAIRRVPVAARASALSLTDMLSVLGFGPTGGLSAALPLVQHAMSSGLMSKMAPPVAGAIRGIIPAISSQAPSVIKGLLSQ